MNETKTNKRGWVKNVAIIFLAVLLLLTFFSNTIQNRSLPEIAGYYAQSGTITTRISGTGTVEAVDSFSVEVKQVREVASVAVRVGDSVKVGDVLFYLSGTESDELDSLMDQLYTLQIAYSKAVIQKTGNDYTKEERAISQARDDLASLQAELQALTPVTAAEVNVLKAKAAEAANKVVSVQNSLDLANKKLTEITYELSKLGTDTSSSDAAKLKSAEAAVTAAEAALTAAENTLKEYNSGSIGIIYAEIEAWARRKADSAYKTYMIHLSDTYFKEMIDDITGAYTYTAAQYETAYKSITEAEAAKDTAEAARDAAEEAYYTAQEAYNSSAEWNSLNESKQDQQYVVDDLTKDLAAATKAQETAEKEHTEAETKLKSYETEYAAAVKAVRTQQNSVDDLVFALSEQQKQDVIDSKVDDLDLQAQSKAISDLAADIAEMQADGTGSEIISSVAGVVRSVNISAGKTANPGTSMMDIDIADRGYTMSFSVTTEQARNLQVGTEAEVSMNYWNTVDVRATLAAIKTDTQNPTTSRILVFNVEGDTAPGASLRVSVGQKSSSFETVVPNSAVKTDSNGDFVLIVETKSSPLSIRYIARRIDVTVLAKDDLNSAVSGALTTSDFVITTSSKPIEAGMQVKMPE